MTDPHLQIREGEGRGGHPNPEIKDGPGLQKNIFGPLGLSLV